MPPAASNSGIVTDETSGERRIPESLRADGTTRKAIKIRPGYRPAEDVEPYRPRNVAAQRERRRIAVPGVEASKDEKPQVPGASGAANESNRTANLSWRRDDDNNAAAAPPSPTTSAAGNKNAKRREARKKARSTDFGDAVPLTEAALPTQLAPPKVEEVNPEVEREKKVRSLKKKLKQAKELKTRKDEGQGLLPEQIAKVIKINELVRELSSLGIDDEGETKKDAGSVSDRAAT